MPRKIAIVGSGIAGLLAAHGLRLAGHEVTLFSDRTPEQWLTSKPTGAAGRFGPALAYEHALGLDFWNEVDAKAEGIQVTLSLSAKNRVLTATAKLEVPGAAIDVRMQSHRWMNELTARGGHIVIETISPARLDTIAAAHDLTLVGVGRGPLRDVFQRDEARSLMDEAPRKIALVIMRNVPLRHAALSFVPVKFNICVDQGEVFWMPFVHKDHGPTCAILAEGIPGSTIDRFSDAKSAEDVLAGMKSLIAERMPWEREWVQAATTADPQGWLVGSIVPAIRGPSARLPSGALAMAIGDTAMSMDPVAGQGANNGTRMAQHIVEAVAARGDGAFDEAWMHATFEAFFDKSGRKTFAFADLMTRPVTQAAQDLFTAQYGSRDRGPKTTAQRVADAISANFVDPTQFTDAFIDRAAAKKLIAQMGGGSLHMLKNNAALAWQQVRQRLGFSPRHP